MSVESTRPARPVTPGMSPADIAQALRLYRFAIIDEHRLHKTLENILDDRGLRYRREVPLHDQAGRPAGRIDFLTEDGIGVEVKVAGGCGDVVRQLRGYAGSPAVTRLLLVTTRREHLDVPITVGGVSVRVEVLRGGL